LISNILDDIEKEGLGPYPPIIDGTLLEEGSFASYVLRKQGSRVSLLFYFQKKIKNKKKILIGCTSIYVFTKWKTCN